MGQITLRWVEEKLMVGSDSNQHSVVIGRLPSTEKDWAGVKPSDLLLMAAASCSAYDVIEILSKQREPFTALKVVCSGEQQSEPPYTFTCIHMHFIVNGEVNPERVARAIQLSEEKYCSVVATLRPGVPVTSDFEILP